MKQEDEIILGFQQPFKRHCPDWATFGDDAALVPKSDDHYYLISQDQLIENIHFRQSYCSPAAIAHKALHSNLSDIAAMGAIPKYLFLGLGLPTTLSPQWLASFQPYFNQQCLQHHVILLGGDTTRSSDQIFISINIIGEAQKQHIKFRKNAKPGDILCVAGTLGEAAAGLYCLEKNILGFEALKQKSLFPNALCQAGEFFGRQRGITAMMDISDGLMTDVKRLCHSSNVGATLNVDDLMPSPVLTTLGDASCPPIDWMLTGGEDYALLLTIDPQAFAEIANLFHPQFDLPFYPIGEIQQDKTITYLKQNKPYLPSLQPFQHF